MKIDKTPIEGLITIKPDCHRDKRGFFLETYQCNRYQDEGITERFIQTNHSRSIKGVLRGMHYQVMKPQAQIVSIIHGSVYYVCVDVRRDSKSFGMWHGVELNDCDITQLYMSPGFAGGFCVLSEVADLFYNVSGLYDPSDEGGVLWNDPDVQIKWPISKPIITSRDSLFPRLKDIPTVKLPEISG
ncbi:MAG: dTDP-4-dehydrorhamnose 3,5-epimerase [Methylophilaceae bacterium]|jgi:dTDP-4-dehydrorhamnose 3,5-epimerase|nr:dTDP-4-dehydrorhamnose 3,5-epimerase [Methylophilaceae bacterium]